MWNTSEGDRILQGHESALFKAGVLALVERVKEEAEFEAEPYCIVVFDELTWSQRLAVLETITTHLLTNSLPAPKLSAVNESAVAMVFEHISFEIDMEIEEISPGTTWRQLVLNAAHESIRTPDDEEEEEEEESDTDHGTYIPDSPNSQRRDLWHPLVHSLADQILWDRDFEMIETFVDEPPEKATMMRQIMGIDEDYFSTAAEDLNSPEEVSDSLGRLSKLLLDA